MPGVLLHQMEQHPLQRRRFRSAPARPRLPHLVQPMRLDDAPAPRPLLSELFTHLGDVHARGNTPSTVVLVSPGVVHIQAEEAQFQPSPLTSPLSKKRSKVTNCRASA